MPSSSAEPAGVEVRPAVWDDPAVDWAAADLVLVRSTWDYAKRRDEFLAWAARVEEVTALHNPLAVLRWSTDKTYLRDLAEAGVPVVPTAFLDSADDANPYADVEHVVKPAVSAGSLDTTRVAPGDATESRRRVEAIVASGRTAMVQPYLHGVDELGETALIFYDGRFSHALRKAALLTADSGEATGLFKEEDMAPREPSEAEHAAAARVRRGDPRRASPLRPRRPAAQRRRPAAARAGAGRAVVLPRPRRPRGCRPGRGRRTRTPALTPRPDAARRPPPTAHVRT